MTKDELLESMRAERSALDEIVEKLTEDELTAPVLEAGRSIKDVLAHITAWERQLVSWLDAAARGETPERPEPGYTFEDIDRLNERDFLADRDRPFAGVRADAQRSFAGVLRAVEAMSGDSLRDEQRFGWAAWQVIRSNTDEHYREHRGAIEARRTGQGT